MKTNRLTVLFVALATLAAALPASAQYGWPGYSSTVAPTIDAQRDAARAATKSFATNGRTNAASSASALPTTRLVAFGVDKYSPEKNGLRALRGCVNDANAIRQTFDYAESTLLTDENATRDAILNELNRAAGSQSERLIVFFGCHGVNVRGRSFVCPVDASLGEWRLSELNALDGEQAVVEAGKEYRLIPLSDILSVLKNASAREVVVVLDACRNATDKSEENDDENGDFMRELLDLNKRNDAFARPNQGAFVVLTSCSVGQEALEINLDGNDFGAFAYYWLEGLKNGSADFAGLADGRVTLVETYNYAYAKTATYARSLGRKQAPEIYASNISNSFVLTILDDAAPPANETDLQFLARTGKILSNVKFVPNVNDVGLKALDCVLDNIPNDVASRGRRAAVRRKRGDYAGALDDYSKIGEKFQLYATRGSSDSNARIEFQPSGEKDLNAGTLNEFDLLTITEIDGDRYFVSEVNNDASKSGWVSAKNASWSLDLNGGQVTTATPTQAARRTSGGGVSANTSGTGPIQPARPFSVPGPLGS